MKTLKELFDYLSRTIDAKCYITMNSNERHFTVCIDTTTAINRFTIELLIDQKERQFYLYNCDFYTEEKLVWKLLEEVSIVIKI